MDFPLTVKNPLTNQIIVGEVEFYLLSNSELGKKIKTSNFILQAFYIGSDYTYAYS